MTSSLVEKTEQEIAGLALPLRALWHAAHGNWETAHQLVQDDPTQESAWVHAYLHRVEGDVANARYWYHQAGKPPATAISLKHELDELIAALDE
jgi:hypothetical protein